MTVLTQLANFDEIVSELFDRAGKSYVNIIEIKVKYSEEEEIATKQVLRKTKEKCESMKAQIKEVAKDMKTLKESVQRSDEESEENRQFELLSGQLLVFKKEFSSY